MRHPTFFLLLLAVCLAGAVDAQPQVTIAGKVTGEGGEPLQGAHVYLAGTMQGTVTRTDGRYQIEGLTLGSHRVVASMIGFELGTHDLVIREHGRHEVDFELERTVYEMGEIEVSLREQRRWLRRLERFERTLLGTSSFADSVRIVNPEVLDFRLRLGRLTASARAPLIIENRALGYRIRYDLTEFDALPHLVRYDGEPLFEELEPRDVGEAERWARNREVAYRGSLRHLLRAMIQDRLEAQDFHVLHDRDEHRTELHSYWPRSAPWRVQLNRILGPAEHENEFVLDFRGTLHISYMGEAEDERFPQWEWNVERRARPRSYQSSEIYLTDGPATFDHRGELVDPFGITRTGYFAFRRLAMLMPVEYGLD